jgi:hypothetical protein
MTTSGTTSFNLELKDIIEEAFERCGSELRTGYDLRTARRSLNLLTIEWANRGINLWTIEEGAITLQTGQATYALPIDTIDLLEHVIRQNAGINATQSDITISRISVSTYASIPNKTAQGFPIQVWVNRQSGTTATTALTLNGGISSSDTTITLSSTDGLSATGYIQIGAEIINYTGKTSTQLQNCIRGQAGTSAAAHLTGAAISVPYLPSISIWPTPNSPGTQYQFVYWRLKRIQDAGDGGVQTQDIPFRLLPCLVAGLAYHLSMKISGAEQRAEILKLAYEEQWNLAAGEDREKASVRFVPREFFIGGGGY